MVNGSRRTDGGPADLNMDITRGAWVDVPPCTVGSRTTLRAGGWAEESDDDSTSTSVPGGACLPDVLLGGGTRVHLGVVWGPSR